MKKPYYFLIPLAFPLFFGGKAAYTAIRKTFRSRGVKNSRSLTADTLVQDADSATPEEIIRTDKHADEIRSLVEQPDIKDELANKPGKDKEAGHSSGEKKTGNEGRSPRRRINGRRKIMTGPKGGKYYVNESGEKIYLKKE